MRRPALPVSLRVPLLAGLAVFVFAVATSRLMLWGMGQITDREISRLGRVYLDGLAAAVLPSVLRDDGPGLEAALNRALGFQQGIRERQIIVGTPAGEHYASAGVGPESEWPAPFLRGVPGETLEFSEDGGAVWAQRPLEEDGRHIAYIAAQLDVGGLARRRQRFRGGMVLFSLALAVVGGGLSAVAARWTMRPVLTVTDALDRAGRGRISPIPNAELPAAGTEARRLALAFNTVVAHVKERDRLERQLAGRERTATLGRLAATVAHEVRNPLAGIVTSVEIIRRFGDDRPEREEAVEVIARGLEQIERVVSSTLAFHRDHGLQRPLSQADLEDLRVLVAPQAEARGVALNWMADLPRPFPVDAAPLRQAVLNLLLNAVAASPAGSRAGLRAGLDEQECLFVEVEDAGPGLPDAARRRLTGEDGPAGAEEATPGLGLEIVETIARRLGARLAVERGGEARGTRITLVVPPNPSDPLCTDPEDLSA
ncbi:hypothetical protein DFH01_23350 [Falsiroseomonas bella]|uniref:histidine kinase n=1 Tax=Falsiroseomonas bella TaxID=2184016 RepID=A0A317F9X2_9PROT|nr:HAMP domain-containing sensor histidine kinase [Falsiroseomonas bella]PWS35243.1 hypothetical protein DFH01_23350 [Falsiroseomonas bella]